MADEGYKIPFLIQLNAREFLNSMQVFMKRINDLASMDISVGFDETRLEGLKGPAADLVRNFKNTVLYARQIKDEGESVLGMLTKTVGLEKEMGDFVEKELSLRVEVNRELLNTEHAYLALSELDVTKRFREGLKNSLNLGKILRKTLDDSQKIAEGQARLGKNIQGEDVIGLSGRQSASETLGILEKINNIYQQIYDLEESTSEDREERLREKIEKLERRRDAMNAAMPDLERESKKTWQQLNLEKNYPKGQYVGAEQAYNKEQLKGMVAEAEANYKAQGNAIANVTGEIERLRKKEVEYQEDRKAGLVLLDQERVKLDQLKATREDMLKNVATEAMNETIALRERIALQQRELYFWDEIKKAAEDAAKVEGFQGTKQWLQAKQGIEAEITKELEKQQRLRVTIAALALAKEKQPIPEELVDASKYRGSEAFGGNVVVAARNAQIQKGLAGAAEAIAVSGFNKWNAQLEESITRTEGLTKSVADLGSVAESSIQASATATAHMNELTKKIADDTLALNTRLDQEQKKYAAVQAQMFRKEGIEQATQAINDQITSVRNLAAAQEERISKLDIKDQPKERRDVQIRQIEDFKSIAAEAGNSAKAIRDYVMANTEAGTAVSEANNQLLELANTLEKIAVDTKKEGDALRQVVRDQDAAARAAGRLRDEQDKLNDRIAIAVGKLLRYRIAFFLIRGAMDALRDSVKSFADIQQGMIELAKVLDPSITNIEKLKKVSFEMAKSYSRDINEVIDVMKKWAQTGLTQKEVIEITKATLKGANAINVEATQVVEALTSAVFTYGLAVEKTTDLVDKWMAVQAKFPATAEDLMKGLQTIGVVAKDFGVGVDELNGIIAGVGAITRRTGKEIAESFKTIFARIPRMESLEVFQRAGVAVLKSRGEFRNFIDVATDLKKVWGDLSKAEQVNIAITIGGIRRYVDFIALMNNFAVVQDAIAVSMGASGTATRATELQLASLNSTMIATKSSVKEVGEAIGQELVKPLTYLLEMVQSLMGEIKNFGAGNVVKIAAFGASFASLYTILVVTEKVLKFIFSKIKIGFETLLIASGTTMGTIQKGTMKSRDILKGLWLAITGGAGGATVALGGLKAMVMSLVKSFGFWWVVISTGLSFLSQLIFKTKEYKVLLGDLNKEVGTQIEDLLNAVLANEQKATALTTLIEDRKKAVEAYNEALASGDYSAIEEATKTLKGVDEQAASIFGAKYRNAITKAGDELLSLNGIFNQLASAHQEENKRQGEYLNNLYISYKNAATGLEANKEQAKGLGDELISTGEQFQSIFSGNKDLLQELGNIMQGIDTSQVSKFREDIERTPKSTIIEALNKDLEEANKRLAEFQSKVPSGEDMAEGRYSYKPTEVSTQGYEEALKKLKEVEPELFQRIINLRQALESPLPERGLFKPYALSSQIDTEMARTLVRFDAGLKNLQEAGGKVLSKGFVSPDNSPFIGLISEGERVKAELALTVQGLRGELAKLNEDFVKTPNMPLEDYATKYTSILDRWRKASESAGSVIGVNLIPAMNELASSVTGANKALDYLGYDNALDAAHAMSQLNDATGKFMANLDDLDYTGKYTKAFDLISLNAEAAGDKIKDSFKLEGIRKDYRRFVEELGNAYKQQLSQITTIKSGLEGDIEETTKQLQRARQRFDTGSETDEQARKDVEKLEQKIVNLEQQRAEILKEEPKLRESILSKIEGMNREVEKLNKADALRAAYIDEVSSAYETEVKFLETIGMREEEVLKIKNEQAMAVLQAKISQLKTIDNLDTEAKIASEVAKTSLEIRKNFNEVNLKKLQEQMQRVLSLSQSLQSALGSAFSGIIPTMIEGAQKRKELNEEIYQAELEYQKAIKEEDKKAIAVAQQELTRLKDALHETEAFMYGLKKFGLSLFEGVGQAINEAFAQRLAEDIMNLSSGKFTLGDRIAKAILGVNNRFIQDYEALLVSTIQQQASIQTSFQYSLKETFSTGADEMYDAITEAIAGEPRTKDNFKELFELSKKGFGDIFLGRNSNKEIEGLRIVLVAMAREYGKTNEALSEAEEAQQTLNNLGVLTTNQLEEQKKIEAKIIRIKEAQIDLEMKMASIRETYNAKSKQALDEQFGIVKNQFFQYKKLSKYMDVGDQSTTLGFGNIGKSPLAFTPEDTTSYRDLMELDTSKLETITLNVRIINEAKQLAALKQLNETGVKQTATFKDVLGDSISMLGAMIASAIGAKAGGGGPGATWGGLIGGELGKAALGDLGAKIKEDLKGVLGSVLGAAVPVLGQIGGSILGGLVGGLFDDNDKKQDKAIEALDDNTTALAQNTIAIQQLDRNIINAPSNFTMPTRFYGGQSPQFNISVQTNNPREFTDQVINLLSTEFSRGNRIGTTRRAVL